MKIRYGYVSNSSSSSYLIGIGIVKKDKIEEVKKLIEGISDFKNSGIVDKEGYLSITSFDDNCVSMYVHTGDFVVQLYEIGDEPEYDEEIDDYNYDGVDSSWFKEETYDVISRSDIFENVQFKIGAGYNG